MSRPVDVPPWAFVPAALAGVLVCLPVAGLLVSVPWSRFLALVTTPDAVAALGLSLVTAVASTVLCVLLGTPLALVLARSAGPLASVVRVLVLLPLVLPPVVGGLALLSVFGRYGLLGAPLTAFGVEIGFTTLAVVLSQAFVAMPFLVLSLDGALRHRLEAQAGAAATLGAGPGRVFTRVTLPLLAPSLAAGAVLCFARSLGEFGATLTFAGSRAGVTRTLPLEIYLQREIDPDAALALSAVLVVVAVLVVGLVLGRRR